MGMEAARSLAALMVFFTGQYLWSVPQQLSNPSTLPHVIKYSGSLKDAPAGTVGVTFAIYDKQDSVASMWLETQSVTADESGHYNVILGSTKADGLPASIFASGEARWIGVQAEGQAEQPRTLLVSVPYALKAGDADTLGGKPLSAFLMADSSSANTSKSKRLGESSAAAPEQTQAVDNGGVSGTVNKLPKWSSGTNLADSNIFDNGTNVGIGTTAPIAKFNIGVIGAAPGGSTPAIAATGGNGVRTSLFLTDSTSGSIWFAGGANVASSVASDAGLNFKTGVSYQTGENDNSKIRVTIDPTGNMGIGTVAPVSKLTIGNIAVAPGGGAAIAGTQGSGIRSSLFLTDFTSGSIWFSGGANQPSSVASDVALNFKTGVNYLGGENDPSKIRMTIDGAGNIGIGTTSPTATLDVNGQIRAGSGVKFSDATVQTTALPSGCTATQIPKWSGSAWTCSADQTGAGGITYPFSSGAQSTPSGAFTVTQSNTVVLANEPTFQFATTSIPAAVVGVSSSTTNSAAGVAGFSNSPDAPAIIGWNGSTTPSAGGNGSQGVIAQTDNTAGTALEATARATSGNTVGVKAHIKSPNGVAISAQDNGGTGMAALFTGKVEVSSGVLQIDTAISGAGFALPVTGGLNVQSGGATISGNTSIQGNLSVSGSVSKNGGTFKIDHPLDPAGKFLYHSFVESPDMMNIYNGVTSLDPKGEAWITMPEWFEALNMDFRYQLTAMGRPAPNLYIAREISGNRFKISGGRANGKVSWQVTGIRHDAWADAHRVQVEEVKSPAEQGTYLSPELFTDSGRDKLANSNAPKR
jgi:hypothetical protein